LGDGTRYNLNCDQVRGRISTLVGSDVVVEPPW
jgi:hypothetical protein